MNWITVLRFLVILTTKLSTRAIWNIFGQTQSLLKHNFLSGWVTVSGDLVGYEELSCNRKECWVNSLAFIILNTFIKAALKFECIIQIHGNSIALWPKLHSRANLWLKHSSNGLSGTQLPSLEGLVLPTYHTLIRVVEPLYQLHRRAFPTATVPNQGHRLPTLDLQVEALQDLPEWMGNKLKSNTQVVGWTDSWI